MKHTTFLLSLCCALFVTTAVAQDFSDPRFAAWGSTPEEREKNLLNNNFLKENLDNRELNMAAHFFQELVKNCPQATENIYIRGIRLYKEKINQASTLAEKKSAIDSLMIVYDLRLQHFGNHPTRGTAYILDRKAREMVIYLPNNRQQIRSTFRQAIEAAGVLSDPETITVYFVNLCEDYKNTDEVMPDEILSEYERLSSLLAQNTAASEYKKQIDTAFGLSGAASCENLEKLYRAKFAATPADEALLAQAVGMMSRAKCTSDYYLELSEKYYALKPTSAAAMFLAQAFQNKQEYAKSEKYLNDALVAEQDPAEQQKLHVRLSLLALVTNDATKALASARKAQALNAEDGIPFFVIAQCYALSAQKCSGIAGSAAYWVAYDTMEKAVSLLPADSEYAVSAKASMASYAARFPSNEELFFNELKPGARYTVNCGPMAGMTTVVRARK